MTESQKVQSPWSDPEARVLLMRKLFSLTGAVPVAAFVLIHLGKGTTALLGREAFTLSVKQSDSIAFFHLIEVVFILLPLLLHALIGILIILHSRHNHRTSRNAIFTFQRVSGVVILLFLFLHLYQFRFQKLMGTMVPADFYDALCASLSSTMWSVPLIALFYVLAIAAVAFHLANGLWEFLRSWSITSSRNSQKISAFLTGALGLIVFAVGANTALYFATGTKFFVPPKFFSPSVQPIEFAEEISDLPKP